MPIETHTYQSSSGAAKIIGIIGFIFSIFSFLFGWVPCIGYYALAPSILSLIFCGLAWLIEQKEGKKVGLYIAGTIISLLAIAGASYQYYNYKATFDAVQQFQEDFDEGMNRALEEYAREADSLKQVNSVKTDTTRN